MFAFVASAFMDGHHHVSHQHYRLVSLPCSWSPLGAEVGGEQKKEVDWVKNCSFPQTSELVSQPEKLASKAVSAITVILLAAAWPG